jgi:hypothetical protein
MGQRARLDQPRTGTNGGGQRRPHATSLLAGRPNRSALPNPPKKTGQSTPGCEVTNTLPGDLRRAAAPWPSEVVRRRAGAAPDHDRQGEHRRAGAGPDAALPASAKLHRSWTLIISNRSTIVTGMPSVT